MSFIKVKAKRISNIGKIVPIFFFTLFFLISLSACNNLPQNNKVEPIIYFLGDFCISNDGYFIEGTLKNEKGGALNLNITSPEQINGLSFSKTENETLIKFNDLAMKSTEQLLPKNSYIPAIFAILDSLKSPNNFNLVSSEDPTSTFIGHCNKIDFELKVDNASRFIKEIAIPKENVVFSLSDCQEIK